MSKDFFIMVNHPNGEIMPIEETKNDYDDKVMVFETLADAQKLAENQMMCIAYGYEIFKLGSGEG